MLRYAIIVAGGSGTRMGGEIPKQFLEVKGLPILMHTLNAFYNFDNAIKLVLVLPTNQMEHWRKLCEQHTFKIKHHLTTGGANRFDSVKNGLALVDTPALIGILLCKVIVYPLFGIQLYRLTTLKAEAK